MARTFDGVDDVLTLALGACGGAGAFAIATLCRRAGTTSWDAIFTKQNGTAAARESIDFEDNATTLDVYVSGSSFTTVSHGLTSTNWNLIVVTKAAGSATPRLHAMPVATRTWSHLSFAAALGDATNDATELRIGDWTEGGAHDYFAGDIAFVGYYERDFTDAQVESAFGGLVVAQMLAANPAGFWLLNQASTAQPVSDLTGGGANESALTGTTVATASVPLLSFGAAPDHVQRVPAAGGSTTRDLSSAIAHAHAGPRAVTNACAATAAAAHASAAATLLGKARAIASAIAHAAPLTRSTAAARELAAALAHGASHVRALTLTRALAVAAAHAVAVARTVAAGGTAVQLFATLAGTSAVAATLAGAGAPAGTLDGATSFSATLDTF